GSAEAFASRLEERGVRLYDVGPQRLRACTHLDLSGENVQEAVAILRAVAREGQTSVDGGSHNSYP
ncbi:MAG: low specificity L-threonine aldolase, partial [Planctomycetaceae bacterium]|nr:low specificity L-threonine aldolase [Planctomycetaceae bacterium]